MDEHQFTVLTRSSSNRPSRRAVLRGLAAAGCGLGAMRLAEDVAAKSKKKRKKRKPPRTCQAGEQIGATVVPGSGAAVTTRVLEQGQRYRLRASGFWSSNATHGQDAFADFPFADPNDPVTTHEGVRLGLSVDGGSPSQWGNYNKFHVYEREVTGQGATLQLRCNDDVHADNSGAVLVEILCA